VSNQDERVIPITRARGTSRGAYRPAMSDGRPLPRRLNATEPTDDEAAWVTAGLDDDPSALVHDHLWLVDRLAGQAARRFPRYVERSELWSAGVLGLVEAARRYDPEYGVPFAAYASARVRGEMLETARAADIAPRRLRRSLRELAEVVERLTHELGRVPTLHEVAEAADLDVSFVREKLDTAANLATTSLDADPSRVAAQATFALTDADPGELLSQQEMLGALREAIAELPEPLKTILVRSHWNEERLSDIAADMGISFQRVAQYRVEAVTALAAWFSKLYDSVPTPDPSLPGAVRRAAFCSNMAQRSTWQARLASGFGVYDDEGLSADGVDDIDASFDTFDEALAD
jgi:RNA polymerase sigma factor for flagellar operon FliA